MAVDIPNYRIVEKLGVGAQTRVFRARCMRTGKDYTVKVVKVVKPEDATFIDLMLTEQLIGSTIDHPAIRKVYELRMLRQRLRVRGAILFMEYVPGLSLADREFKASTDEYLRIFAEAGRGLEAMHRAGYVHADMKPNNILVTPDGTVKIIDLGQSSRIHEAKPRVQGTIHYMAPEQVERGVLDQRTDVFGLGATLYHALTGRFIKTGMNQTISVHAQGLVGRRLEELRQTAADELPKSIARLIADCCQENPDDRIPDMHSVVERLELARSILNRPPAADDDGEDDDEDDVDDIDVEALYADEDSADENERDA